MAENSKIEWTDHTFNPTRLEAGLDRRPQLQPIVMHQPMTSLAECYTVSDVSTAVGVIGKRPDVVGVQVAASVVSTVDTSKLVPQKHVIAPAFKFSARALALSLNRLAINVSRRPLSASSAYSHLCADLRSRLKGMRLSDSVAYSRLRRSAHLRAAFVRHALTLHRRNEGSASLHPRLFNNLAAGADHHG